jgi:hypothetical protein
VQFLAGHNLRDEPDLQCTRRREPFGTTEQGQAEHFAQRHAPQEMQRLVHGGHAEGDVRIEEGGVVGGDDDVGFTEQVGRSPAGDPVDGSDDRLPEAGRLRSEEFPDILTDVGARVRDELAAGIELIAVIPRTEGLFARPGEDDDPHLVAQA